MVFDEVAPPKGKQYKKPDNELLLKAVNSDRFCPHCEEDLQNTLDTLRYVSSKETDTVICALPCAGGSTKRRQRLRKKVTHEPDERG
jgi:hypothetical protein